MAEHIVTDEDAPDAFEQHCYGDEAPVFISCEHASQRMPPGWSWPELDRRLFDSHFAYDIGARDLSLELAKDLKCSAILSRFSRLLIDPNRPEDSPSLILGQADGLPVELNRDVLPSERERRLRLLYRPYHRALDCMVAASSAKLLFSVHTFTPVFEGRERTLEVGVLYDREEAAALQLGDALKHAGIGVELNEPYSGKAGLMYSIDQAAQRYQRAALELEVRQDLAQDSTYRARLVPVLAGALRRLAA
ncbi:MAG: N-formylglutamate amidohydrolase [Myxococcota bacterium]